MPWSITTISQQVSKKPRVSYQFGSRSGLRMPQTAVSFVTCSSLIGFLGVPGCPRGGGNWGTLRIPREDWGTLGEHDREASGNHQPPLRILLFSTVHCSPKNEEKSNPSQNDEDAVWNLICSIFRLTYNELKVFLLRVNCEKQHAS